MCDDQHELADLYALWVFPLQIRLAVEGVLKERGREIIKLSQPEFEAALARILSKDQCDDNPSEDSK